MGIQLKNNASGTLATAISASDTGIVLTTGNGASFPALGAGDYFYATLESTGGTFEVIKVTARSGDSLTVTRAQEGTSAQSFAAGSRIEARVTAQSVIDTAIFQRRFVFAEDYGAVGDGATDDAAAINAAITAVQAAGGGAVMLQAKTYVVGATIALPDYVQLKGAGQKATTIKLGASANVNIIERKSGALGLGMGLFDMTIDGNQLNNTQGGVYLLGATDLRGPSWQVERVRVTKCRNCVMGSGVKAAFFVGGNTWSVFRDIEVYQNDYAQIAIWIGAADGVIEGLYLGTNGYNFGGTAYGMYVTSAGNFFTNCYFGGTQPGPQLRLYGAVASSNKFANCIFDNAGQNGIEFADSAYGNQFVNCQIGNSSYSDGGTYYAVLNSTNGGQTFTGCTFYSSYATAPATHAYYEPPGITGNSQFIGCEFEGTYLSTPVAIQSNSTSQFVGCKGYDITNVGTLRASTQVDIRGPYSSAAPTTGATPLLRVNNGGALSTWFGNTAYSYTWMQSIQDDGTNNIKPLKIQPLGGGVILGTSGMPVTPDSDNAQTLGSAGNRWSVVYAGTGTINTSDAREKQQVAAIDAAVLRAWAKVEYSQFRFNDAVAVKGGGARLHFGLVAQRVKEAFESEGLDAFKYGLLCYDEWDAKYEDVYDESGKPTGARVLVAPAGNRYGIRYEEALALECAYLRSQLTKGANNG